MCDIFLLLALSARVHAIMVAPEPHISCTATCNCNNICYTCTAANSEARISCCGDLWGLPDCPETVENQAACKNAVLTNLILQGTILISELGTARVPALTTFSIPPIYVISKLSFNIQCLTDACYIQ